MLAREAQLLRRPVGVTDHVPLGGGLAPERVRPDRASLYGDATRRPHSGHLCDHGSTRLGQAHEHLPKVTDCPGLAGAFSAEVCAPAVVNDAEPPPSSRYAALRSRSARRARRQLAVIRSALHLDQRVGLADSRLPGDSARLRCRS
jgi:hypothetical protein